MLHKHPGAQRAHEAGHDAAMTGRFREAAELYQDAARQLGKLALEDFSASVQLGHVERDNAWLTLLQGIDEYHRAEETPEAKARLRANLETARQQLRAARNRNAPAAEISLGARTDNPEAEERRAYFSEVWAEQGATIGLQARLAAYEEMLFGTSEEDPEVLFAEAHQYLEPGNNPYYLTSNAIRRAEYAEAVGNPDDAFRYWGDAQQGLARALQSGSPDLNRCRETLNEHLGNLTYKTVAQQAILGHP